MENKNGQIYGILVVIGMIFVLLFVGVLIAFGSATINYVFDESMPEFTSLGQVGSVNASQVSTFALTPVDTFVQNLTWLSGVAYFLGLIAIFGLAFAFKVTGQRWLIGLYIMLVFTLVISSIFISNIYEDFHGGTDEIALRLQEQTLLSYLIIYSPVILSIVSLIAGVILFSGSEGGDL